MQSSAESKPSKPAPESKSYAVNMFRGVVHPEQVFPFADVLTADQKEMLEMLVDPTEKFFKEVNDAAKNDDDAKIPEATLQALKDLGAFGLQVKQYEMNMYMVISINEYEYFKI